VDISKDILILFLKLLGFLYFKIIVLSSSSAKSLFLITKYHLIKTGKTKKERGQKYLFLIKFLNFPPKELK